ncbi:hypothetical protein [Lacinutrix salivirga]
MNCQQKSGVFLNIECQNTKQQTCSNCEKEVCDTHSLHWETTLFCEDCYWEHFLISTTQKQITHLNNSKDDVLISTTAFPSKSASNTTEQGGFKDGFGGGEFGGGGASAGWTEGDMQSLNETDNQGGFLSDTDDTFFYS